MIKLEKIVGREGEWGGGISLPTKMCHQKQKVKEVLKTTQRCFAASTRGMGQQFCMERTAMFERDSP